MKWSSIPVLLLMSAGSLFATPQELVVSGDDFKVDSPSVGANYS